jgi:hypothetical protein
METEDLKYKIVLLGLPNSEILARAAHLDIASAAYMAAVARHPNRDVQPEPPRDPNLKSWSAHLIGGKQMQHLGYVEATDEPAAIEAAVTLFGLDDSKRSRLAVNLRR